MPDDRIVAGAKGYFRTPILPSFYARVGPQRLLFLDYSYANFFPGPSPGMQHQISIGSGLGFRKDVNFRFGALGHEGLFLSAKFPINKLSVESLYYWNTVRSYDFSPSKFNISLGYRYDLPDGRKLR